MKGPTPNELAWELPPAEPDVIKNFASYFHALQVLKKLADALGDKMVAGLNQGITAAHAKPLVQDLDQLSHHLGELIFRMEDDNFFPVGPDHDPPLPDAKARALDYIKAHPRTPDHVLKWLLRSTYELEETVVAELLREGKIEAQEDEYVAR